MPKNLKDELKHRSTFCTKTQQGPRNAIKLNTVNLTSLFDSVKVNQEITAAQS